MTSLLLTFVALSIANVILQTIKSIATIKCGKAVASLVNAIAYGLYTFVIVYTNCELDIWVKAGITAFANFVGVYIVKYFEEKGRKDKLWKVELSVPATNAVAVDQCLGAIPHSKIDCNNGWVLFNCYCDNCKVSQAVKNICQMYNAKFFVTEQNGLL